MKLVQIVKAIETDVISGGKCFEIIADYESVPDALNAISDDQHGDGPFDIVSVNRRGVKLQAVTEKIMDIGEAFGPKSAGRKPAPKPPPVDKPASSSAKHSGIRESATAGAGATK